MAISRDNHQRTSIQEGRTDRTAKRGGPAAPAVRHSVLKGINGDMVIIASNIKHLGRICGVVVPSDDGVRCLLWPDVCVSGLGCVVVSAHCLSIF